MDNNKLEELEHTILHLQNEKTLLEDELIELKRTSYQKFNDLCNREHKSKKFIEVIINTVADPIFVKDKDCNWIILNDAYCSFIGKSREQLLGKNYFDFLSNNEAEALYTHDINVLSTGIANIKEEEFTTGDGSVRTISTKRARCLDPENNEYLLVGSIRDITDSKKLEQQLRNAKEEAESANKAKSDFLANMSHELRTPINSILGITQLLQDRVSSPESLKFLDIIKKSCQHLLNLIMDVLDLTKIEAGRFNIDEVSFSIKDLAIELYEQYYSSAKDKDILFYCSIDPNIPEFLIADRTRLKQIFINLIDNSLKFTKSGEIFIELYLENDMELHGTVYDTGIGISEEQQHRVFEKFVQVDTSHCKEFQGAGLGLAICRRLVDALGGRLWVESVLDLYSAFHFTINVKPSISTEFQESRHPIICSTSDRYKILVAEDHEVGGMIVKTFLQDNGYDVDLVTNGKDALFEMIHNDYNLVIMDIQMPIMDGLTAIKIIRSKQNENINSNIPIIALTAYAMLGDKKKILTAGADDYISKPFEKETLLDTIKRVLDGNSKR